MSISSSSATAPLAGVRVLDLSRVLAGPMCAMALGDLGAEVIKVEHPLRGDDTRDWGLKVSASNTSYFNSANRNKSSIGIDLSTDEGKAIVHELAARSDVLIHNFRHGGAEKLGLGYAQLQALNQRLVYCCICGYDSAGAEAARPGYDLMIQGEAGLMALNGEPGQGPLKFGIAAVDVATGMYAAQAILAALYRRQRDGKGCHIEMALFDCGLSLTAYYGLDALLLGHDPLKYGNKHPSVVPYGMFEAKDGPLIITVGNNQQFRVFCTHVIGRPDLATDPRFASNLLRMQHRAALLPQLEQALGCRARAELLAALNEHGIPCGEVNGLWEALSSPRAVEGGMVTQQPNADAGTTPVLAPPYQFDGQRPSVRQPPPQLGEHTACILQSVLGMQAARVDELKARGII